MILLMTFDVPETVSGINHRDEIVDPRARATVAASFAAYGRCRTYRDTGIYESDHKRIEFATRFKRPDRILFTYTSKGKTSAYWSRGERKKVIDDFEELGRPPEVALSADGWYASDGTFEPNRSLGMAVAGFTGISRGTGNTVPNMLFPSEVSALSFADMVDLRYEGVATARGVKCEVLHSKRYMTRAWIDRRTHLLRRLVERDDPAQPEQVTLYLPEVNVPIRDEEMVFIVPAKP